MAFRKLFGFMATLALSINTWAEETQIIPVHPEQYQQNRTCVLTEDDIKNGRAEFSVSAAGKLLPCIRETPIKKATKTIPAESIAQFLTSPKVVTEIESKQAPYVLNIAGERLIAGTGDKIYVRSITQPQSHLFTIYRTGTAYLSPETGENLGYNAEYIADAKLLQTGDPATLSIIKSSSEIRIGDRIMPSAEDDITLTYFPRPPNKPINGRIISVLGGVSQIGQFNVVVLDKGTQDGILTGHELVIYQNGKTVNDPNSAIKNDSIKLPDEIAGHLMVFRSFERVSYALVMKAEQAIHILDKVKTP